MVAIYILARVQAKLTGKEGLSVGGRHICQDALLRFHLRRQIVTILALRFLRRSKRSQFYRKQAVPTIAKQTNVM